MSNLTFTHRSGQPEVSEGQAEVKANTDLELTIRKPKFSLTLAKGQDWIHYPACIEAKYEVSGQLEKKSAGEKVSWRKDQLGKGQLAKRSAWKKISDIKPTMRSHRSQVKKK